MGIYDIKIFGKTPAGVNFIGILLGKNIKCRKNFGVGWKFYITYPIQISGNVIIC
jgi:hypothetical protein